MLRKLLLSFLLLMVSLPGVCDALSLDAFDCITDESTSNCEAGTAQLTGTLVDGDPGEAFLTIANDGLEQLVLARIFLESDLVSDFLHIDDGVTSFSVRRGPPVLPGAGRDFEVAHSLKADPAPPKNGIGPGESATFQLLLVDGATVADLVGELRIGVHVIAFEDGGSESFITQPIPEPGVTVLVGLGLGALGVARRGGRRSGAHGTRVGSAGNRGPALRPH